MKLIEVVPVRLGLSDNLVHIVMRKLQQAIKAGDTEQVTELIADKKEANARFTKGWTPLHTAVKHGKKEVVATILNAGADGC